MHQKNSAADPATHVVVGKEHVRFPTTTESGEMEVFEVGDPITPTDAELRAFSDRFVTVDSAGRIIEDDTKDAETDELTPEEQAAHTYRETHLSSATRSESDDETADEQEEED